MSRRCFFFRPTAGVFLEFFCSDQQGITSFRLHSSRILMLRWLYIVQPSVAHGVTVVVVVAWEKSKRKKRDAGIPIYYHEMKSKVHAGIIYSSRTFFSDCAVVAGCNIDEFNCLSQPIAFPVLYSGAVWVIIIVFVASSVDLIRV